MPIVGIQERVIGVNAGLPNNAQWPAVIEEANRVLSEVGPQLKETAERWQNGVDLYSTLNELRCAPAV